ncbi:hypothetical protein E8E11_010641 [Didymella keratinophila]|nr:hypothetical protein E8E11_010641 [Didymella keratinophila]
MSDAPYIVVPTRYEQAQAPNTYSQQLTQQLLAVLSNNQRRISALEDEKQDVTQQQLTVENAHAGRMISQERQRSVEEKQAFVEVKRAFAEEKMAFEAERPKLAATDDAPKNEVLKAASICYWAFGPAKQQFNANPKQIDWSGVRLPPSFSVDINDRRVKQLRQHDYYTGWLDSMSAYDTLQAWSDRKVTLDAIQYVFDMTDIHSPMNAGRNVSMIFGWLAICNNNMPEHDARLDDRVWGLQQLVPRSEHLAGSGRDFWQGIKWGKETASGLFEMTVESGIW